MFKEVSCNYFALYIVIISRVVSIVFVSKTTTIFFVIITIDINNEFCNKFFIKLASSAFVHSIGARKEKEKKIEQTNTSSLDIF